MIHLLFFFCLLRYLLFNNRDPLTLVLDLTIAYISKCDTCFCQKRTAKIGHVIMFVRVLRVCMRYKRSCKIWRLCT